MTPGRRAGERAAARRDLVEHEPEREQIRALVERLAAHLLGRHVGRRPDRSPPAMVSAAIVVVGAASSSTSFATPKSSTFTSPRAVTKMLAGLRSRWTMPRACAASSASASCMPHSISLLDRQRLRLEHAVERLALEQLHHEERAVRRARRRRKTVQMCGWFTDAIARASRWKRSSACGSPRHGRGQHLDGDVAIEPRVVRAIDLAHAAGADGRDDFIRPETGSNLNGH